MVDIPNSDIIQPMRNDIEEKLRTELSGEIRNEPQVVYILSRIRKLLEIDKKEREYKILKFFCDWALHAEIENTDPIRDLLDKIIEGGYSGTMATSRLMLDFSDLHKELEKFLKGHNISAFALQKISQRHKFEGLLSLIYSDAPLVIKTVKKKRLIWKGEYDQNGHGGSWKIEIENVK